MQTDQSFEENIAKAPQPINAQRAGFARAMTQGLVIGIGHQNAAPIS